MAPRIDWDKVVEESGFKSLEDLFVTLYNMEGLSLARLGARIGLSEMSVGAKMKQIGFPRRPHSCNKQAWRNSMNKFFTKRR